MTLGEKRREFTKHLGLLIVWLYENGYEAQIEEAKRSQAQADANAASGAGIKNSLHIIGLAADISIFKDGIYLHNVDDYRPAGEYWKSLHSENAWGGDFSKPDSDHFSRSNDGVR